MSKSLLTIIAASLLIYSCNGKKDIKTEDQTEGITDAEFDKIFMEFKADSVNISSLITYKSTEKPIKPPLKGMQPQGERTSAVEDFPNEIKLPHLGTELEGICNIPKSIADLNSGGDIKIYKFDRNTSANAKVFGFEGDIGKKQMLLIQDYTRYELVTCSGVEKKIGIGLRCFILVKSFKGKLGTASFPKIAANVELDRAEATFELKALGFGLNATDVAKGLEGNTYDVSSFANLAITFNNVLTTLKEDGNRKINPVVLP